MKIAYEKQKLLQKDITLLKRKLKQKGLLSMIRNIIPELKPQALRDDFRYACIFEGRLFMLSRLQGIFGAFLKDVELTITARKAILRSEGKPDSLYVSFQLIYKYEYTFGQGLTFRTVQFDFIDGKEVTPNPFPSDPDANPQNLSLWS